MNEMTEATILAVDDDEVSRTILKRVLADTGCRVFAADSGKTALDLVDQIEPRLILLDVMMPGMDGYELCGELQARGKTANTPVVFLTALGDQQDKARGFALGAVDYVIKPIQPKQLVQVVTAQLQTGLRWLKLSEHRNASHGAIAAAPHDFLQFKQFLIQQHELDAGAQKRIAALLPADLYASLARSGIGETQGALSIANFLKLPYLPTIEPESLQMGILPPPFASANLVVAIVRGGKNMFALANPFDRALIEALTKFSGLGDQCGLAITAPKNIKALFEKTVPAHPVPELLDRVGDVGSPPLKTTPSRASGAMLRPAAAGNLALVKPDALGRSAHWESESILLLTDRLLKRAVAERASDIHIEPKDRETVVRLRIDGDMREISTLKNDTSLMLMSRLKAMGGMDIAERRRPQDGACETKIDGRQFKLRLATTSTPDGESLILRLLEPGSRAKSLTELGMTDVQMRALTLAANSTQGLILVVGPTGSGKTTTIFSVLSQVDTQTRSLISVEDPVEYRIPFANQQQVNEKAGINFESLLKSAVRQDPDILFLGEIRDNFSSRASMDFASTGHLTISTLHTSNATSSIFRLERLGVTRTMMSDSILVIVAQRLLKRLCPYCKEVGPITEREAARLAPFTRQIPSEVAHPVGCVKCNQIGYLGREGVYEVVRFDTEVADMLHSNKPVAAIREFSYRRGDYLISHHAVDKVAQMLVSVEDAYQRILAEEVVPENVPTPPKAVVRAQEVPVAAKPVEHGTSILLVEDDRESRALIESHLAEQDYRVTVADDGVDALMQLGRTTFDLVLSDINAAEFDGFKLLQAMQKKGIQTPVVFLSADADEEAEIKGLEMGVAEYIKKPVNRELFLLKIKKVLKR
jgi:type II secretory ATPase GspE/PulE/Tfp pilus assembly ATPase PilB-like protein/DNA-binding response OmpR family regulator